MLPNPDNYVKSLQLMIIDNDINFAYYKHQIIPFHIVIYYLLPETHNKDISEYFDNQLQAFFHQNSFFQLIMKCYAMNSRVSEPKNLHLSVDIDVKVL